MELTIWTFRPSAAARIFGSGFSHLLFSGVDSALHEKNLTGQKKSSEVRPPEVPGGLGFCLSCGEYAKALFALTGKKVPNSGFQYVFALGILFLFAFGVEGKPEALRPLAIR